MQRSSSLKEAKLNWELYELPVTMNGADFLDVGCWGGAMCLEAIMLGAKLAVGVDSVESPNVRKIKEQYLNFRFLQMDIYSPHWFSLPRFDVVLAAGVLYHVPDPVGLLHRLKHAVKDGGLLVIETAVEGNAEPYMRYCRDKSFDNNFSNWFIPSCDWVFSIAEEIGLKHVTSFMARANRGLFHFELSNELPKKTLPRKQEYMDE